MSVVLIFIFTVKKLKILETFYVNILTSNWERIHDPTFTLTHTYYSVP